MATVYLNDTETKAVDTPFDLIEWKQNGKHLENYNTHTYIVWIKWRRKIDCIACRKIICHDCNVNEKREKKKWTSGKSSWRIERSRCSCIHTHTHSKREKRQYFDFSSIMTYFHKNSVCSLPYIDRNSLSHTIAKSWQFMLYPKNPFDSIKQTRTNEQCRTKKKRTLG